MTDVELNRRNLRFAWLLFGIFWLIFGGCFAVAYLYLHYS